MLLKAQYKGFIRVCLYLLQDVLVCYFTSPPAFSHMIIVVATVGGAGRAQNYIPFNIFAQHSVVRAKYTVMPGTDFPRLHFSNDGPIS